MDLTPIVNEIRARITSKRDDERALAAAGNYHQAQRLKDQREELENLLLVLPEVIGQAGSDDAVKALLDHPVWPQGLEAAEMYVRRHDEGDEALRVLVGEDGDAYISVTGMRPGHSVRFCTRTGGGKSPRVRAALLVLAEAIRLDNETDPGRG